MDPLGYSAASLAREETEPAVGAECEIVLPPLAKRLFIPVTDVARIMHTLIREVIAMYRPASYTSIPASGNASSGGSDASIAFTSSESSPRQMVWTPDPLVGTSAYESAGSRYSRTVG